MRVAAITVQNYPKRNEQNFKNANYSTPIQKQDNYDIYFKSLEGITNANKSSIKTSKNVSFTGLLDNLHKVAGTALVPVEKDAGQIAKTVVHSSAQLLQETVLPAIEAKTEVLGALGHFGSVDSVKALYQETKPEIVVKLDALVAADEGNAARVGRLYQEFATGNLLTLASEGDKGYTGFWAKNKRFGRKGLVNFWLEKAGMNPKGKTPAQKAEMLNGIDPEEKQRLIGDTIEHWVETILPRDLDKLRKKDLKHLEAAAKEHPFVESETEDVRGKMLSMIESDGIEQFEAIQQGDKNLVDFWLDTIDGEGAAKDFSAAQKKRRLIEILESSEDLDKLRQQTIAEAGRTSEQIKRAQSACQNLIAESELDQASQELLQTYQDSQLFFQVAIGGAKNATSVANLEASTQRLLAELAQEQTTMLKEGRTKVFNPLRDLHYLTSDPGNDNTVQSGANDLATILRDKIKTATPAEIVQIKQGIHIEPKVPELTLDLEKLKVLWADLEANINGYDGLCAWSCVKEAPQRYQNAIDRAYAKLRELGRHASDGERSTCEHNIDVANENWIKHSKYEKVPLKETTEFNRLLAENNPDIATHWETFRQFIMSKLDAKRQSSGYFSSSAKEEESKLTQQLNAFGKAFELIPKREDLKIQALAIVPQWLKLVDVAQGHFEGVQVAEVLDRGLKHRRTVQKALAQKPPVEIQQALEAKTLTPVQKDLVARYAGNPHLRNLLAQPAGKYGEDISNLAALEQLNWSWFDSMSEQFRTHLSLDTVNKAPKITDIYVHALGVDPTRLGPEQKYQLLSRVPSEELELASHAVRKYVEERVLVPAMSDAIQNKVRVLDPGHNTAQMVHQLDNISVQLDGQQHTLTEIAGNIDHFIDVYKETSARMIGVMRKGFGDISSRLGGIARSLEGIHADTSSVRNNIKATLFQSIKNTRNRIYREELQGLLDDADKQELSEFMDTVNRRQKKFREDHPDEVIYEFVKDEMLPNVLRASPMLLLGLLL